MKQVIFRLFLLGSLLMPNLLFAQNARLTGQIIDATSAEPMFGVAVVIKSINAFTQTDFEGRYTLEAPPGDYEVTFQIAVYEPQIRKVTLVAGQTTNMSTIALGVKTAQEVVVQGRQLNNTQASLLALQRKSGAVSDGVSQEAIKKSPDSSASDVLKRVTGITIVDGKYVFVRGLGERYSTTELNGTLLSSPEPDKRVVPLDLFPAALIKNIRIIKSFLPEDPAEFSGGLVKIETQEFPDVFSFAGGLTLGGNANTTQRHFQTYKGGKKDYLGKDDGTRALPEAVRDLPPFIPVVRGTIFGGLPNAYVGGVAATMPNTWDSKTINAPFDRDLKLSVGDAIPVGTRSKFGYLLGTSYGRKWRFRESKENTYAVINPVNQIVAETAFLSPLITSDVKKWTETVLWGNNVNLSYEFVPNQRVFSKTFYSRNSDKYVRKSEGFVSTANGGEPVDFSSQNTGWIGREILHQVFGGEHALNFSPNWRPHKLDWSVGYSKANRDEPNLTQQLFQRPAGIFDFRTRATSTDNALQFYSFSEDLTETGAFNYEIPFSQWSGLQSKFKFGAMASDRVKELRNRTFNYVPQSVIPSAASNEFTPGSVVNNLAALIQNGYRFQEQTSVPNFYDAEQKLHAYYGQLDIPLVAKFRFVGGARYEDSFQTVKTYEAAYPLGYEFDPSNYYNVAQSRIGKLHTKDLLPSANLIAEITGDMNLRFGYTETVNRPDFRDLSPVGFQGTFGGDRIFGNNQLARAYVHNYDARWEWYMTADDYLGVGAFYKGLSNPIEKIGLSSLSTNRDFTFINAKNGEIRGLEFEFRKYFAERFGFESNLFFIRSRVEVMDWVDQTFIRVGLVDPTSRRAIYNPTNLERDLEGQSPYVYNVKFNYYLDKDRLSSIGLLYNIFGDRIDAAGSSGAPDQIEKGAGVLDLVFEKKIGERLDIKAAAKNILDTRFKVVQKNPLLNNQEQIVRSYRDGVSYSFSMNYKL